MTNDEALLRLSTLMFNFGICAKPVWCDHFKLNKHFRECHQCEGCLAFNEALELAHKHMSNIAHDGRNDI